MRRGSILILMILPVFAAALFWGREAMAAASFENASDIKKFKALIKKDMFYRPGEKLKPVVRDDETRSDGASEKQQAESVSSNAQKPKGRSADENFKVEGIIKIGKGGCAIINSKIWYFERPYLGYKIVEIDDEFVNIKAPDGRIIKCVLVKEKNIERNMEQ